MRFVTFLGLTIIAKCIDPDRVAAFAELIATVCIVALIIDVIELFKNLSK